MKIVADRDILGVEEAFSPYGDLVLLPGRRITADDVRHADALLVRTVTRIDQALVEGSTLKFVGSATSGIDHVDTGCLAAAGIAFRYAPGCNADAVVNYILAALAWLGQVHKEDWRRRTVGIIGAGQVGGRLARVLGALGMDVAIYDPLLAPTHSLALQQVSLEAVLSRGLVTLHVPLTFGGPFPTFHMLDNDRLSLLDADAILINAARGEVVDNAALDTLLAQRPRQRVVLDTWEGEPAIRPTLLDKVTIGTPHIAGYSMLGKRNGTAAVLAGFCAHFSLEQKPVEQATASRQLALPASGDLPDLLNRAILQAYPVAQDFLPAGRTDLAMVFDARRNNYAFRAQFSEFSVDAGSLPAGLVTDLATLGFKCL